MEKDGREIRPSVAERRQRDKTQYRGKTVERLNQVRRQRNKPRKEKNKAGYTATLVACGWAGAVFEFLERFGKCSEAKDHKNIKKVKWGMTNRPTNQLTDGQSGV